MGHLDVGSDFDGQGHRGFIRHLLSDLAQLEDALRENIFETDIRRIGAEQEMFLVDDYWQPAPVSVEVLDQLEDDRFTTELARFNLEANLKPLVFGGNCLSVMEQELRNVVQTCQTAARSQNANVLLTGILPTLRETDLALGNMTPRKRYFALNEAVRRMRGDHFQVHIKGTDELLLRHDSVMLEACNTSFQLHFQVSPEEFAQLYNIAQLVTAPVLAAAVNSPLLFTRKLWAETRIALFQQSIDTRVSELHLRKIRPRVSFGDSWIQKSVVEVFREDIARFRALLSVEGGRGEARPRKLGEAPELDALRLHNGTVYRWNRPCYGVNDGKPHLRIENRVLPAGPTIQDEMANAAFFFGLMAAFSDGPEDIASSLHFDDAKTNFLAAATLGLNAQFRWLDDKAIPAGELILNDLVPRARDGLLSRDIDTNDVENYLSIINDRVKTGQTGSLWQTRSVVLMEDHATNAQCTTALTALIFKHQKQGDPVHTWPIEKPDEDEMMSFGNYLRVEQLMTTDLYTVSEDEGIELVLNLMDWQKIRHIPVENSEHQLVGLVSYRSLIRLFAQATRGGGEDLPTGVRQIMNTELITATPETSTLDAVRLMTENRIGCLPVVRDQVDNHLVGILTERDFMRISRELVEDELERHRQSEEAKPDEASNP